MNFNQNSVSEILKDGTKHLSGLEQSMLRNIEAVRDLSELTRTSMGPNGISFHVDSPLSRIE
jgi:T-complex protein 1 subunit theta